MGHSPIEKLKETGRSPCWTKVNWLPSTDGADLAGINLHSLSERPSGLAMLGWTKWATGLAVAVLAMGGAAPRVAAGDTTVAVQRLGPPEVEARRDALLKQMIAQPNDLDLAFQYATLSAQVGDYEGAISTLERMLIYEIGRASCRERVFGLV